MSKIRLDATSEQNILNMLLDRSVINDNQLSKINSTSDEVGKTKLETASPDLIVLNIIPGAYIGSMRIRRLLVLALRDFP